MSAARVKSTPTVIARLQVVPVLAAALLMIAVPARGADGDDGAARDEAGSRFRRGVELYSEGDLAAAMVEFSRAYQLAPRYKMLFNMAQIAYQQQDYATALRHFRRYLADGGDEIPAARQAFVQQEIRKLEQRVARLDIRTTAGARVLVDGLEVGVAPLGTPVETSIGRRHVEAVSSSGERRDRFVDLAGGDLVTVLLESPAAKATATGGTRVVEDAPLPLVPAGAAGVVQREPEPAVPPRTRRNLWVPWTATAVLVAGAAVAGGLALAASRDLRDARDTYPATSERLGELHDRTRTLSLVADGALVAAAIMAAVSTYLTLRAPTAEGRPPSPRVSLGPSGRGLGVAAWF